jgi:hypothetical protein
MVMRELAECQVMHRTVTLCAVACVPRRAVLAVRLWRLHTVGIHCGQTAVHLSSLPSGTQHKHRQNSCYTNDGIA